MIQKSNVLVKCFVNSSLAPVSKSEPHVSHVSKSISPTSLELTTVNQNKSSTPSNTTKLPKLSLQQSHSTKRLLQSDDDLKLKKKKVEKSDAGLQSSSAKPPKDVPILTNISNSDNNDVLKGKGFLQTYKKPKELKKVNEVQSAINSPTASKPKELKHRGKELKTKKEKLSSPESSLKDDLPKLPKFLITRMTDDVYVKKSTATNGGVTMTNGGNINLNHSVSHVNSSNSHEHAIQPESKSVSALLAEFGQDDHSSDDSMHIDLSSDLTKTSKADIPTSVVTSVAHTSESSNKNTFKPKKSKVHKSILNGDSNEVQKREVTKIRATDAGKTLPKPSPTPNDLYELYKALNNCQDDDKLQKVVDIVEESGQFDITATTFDFNLCLLDQESITLLKQLILS